MLRKFCIINTCGSEDCGNHQQDHEHGAYYLVQDVDARIAELEKALTKISNNVMCPQFFREIAANALMET